MDDQLYEDNLWKISDAITEKGKHKDYRVSYAMENELDKIALEGNIKIIFDEYYESDIILNPTYLEICVIANDMINECDFQDHIYLEDIIFVKKDNNINIYTLHFGS